MDEIVAGNIGRISNLFSVPAANRPERETESKGRNWLKIVDVLCGERAMKNEWMLTQIE